MAKGKDKEKDRGKSGKGGKEKGAKKGKKAGRAGKATPVSPLAPRDGFPALPVVAGVEFAAAAAGVRYPDRLDVMLVRLAPGTSIAGVFTRSATRSAPVRACEARLALKPDPKADAAIVVNSGNSNAFTGAAGEASVDIDGAPVTIAGIAKGSGMIAPDMATMLVYLFTDARIGAVPLQRMLSRAVNDTFNCITVDGDTSTSDTLILAATGRASAPEIRDVRTRQGRAFYRALHGVMLDLAHQIVRDGEGATKFVEVAVTGARDAADARRVAMAIANSPLVKTAVAGQDPNWGRIVMAVGKSGAAADRDRLRIMLGDVLVAENGMVAPGYREADGAAHMRGETIRIGVDLGLGKGKATVWTCDLTERYIAINADYRS